VKSICAWITASKSLLDLGRHGENMPKFERGDAWSTTKKYKKYEYRINRIYGYIWIAWGS